MVVYLSFLALLWDFHPLASATVTVKQLVLPTCLILALLLGYHLAECFKLLEVIESVTHGLLLDCLLTIFLHQLLDSHLPRTF